jgi:hypothetical protein
MGLIDQVIDSYKLWLEVKAPDHRKEFLHRLTASPEAARAEAAVFGLLRKCRLNPRPGEVIGQGGPDFICEPASADAFIVEVTALSPDAVSAKSRLPHREKANHVGWFDRITTSLLREAINKTPQLANYPMPRLLVLATEHEGAALLMNARSAEELLTGTTMISGRIGDLAGDLKTTTYLSNSVFCRLGADGVEPARQSISAILLASITEGSISVIGLLHPEPAIAFSPAVFARVHFVRFATWPIRAGHPLRTEWIGPTPETTFYEHSAFTFNEPELRSLE